MSEVKWTDERIYDYANNLEMEWHARSVYDAMLQVRDDMQATIDELEAKVTRLTAALVAACEALLAMDETGDDNE